uniref:Uncharacterized protein LOC111112658 isoform X2 n=1 Tax=Crassostrea virginica TaxID=6565 RepID=A0A8B8BRV3_CRAVI|nr:uncharacterized protein LOC111112658 isoform X2 [Crassostrea virginica]
MGNTQEKQSRRSQEDLGEDDPFETYPSPPFPKSSSRHLTLLEDSRKKALVGFSKIYPPSPPLSPSSLKHSSDDTQSTLKKSELRPDDPGLPDPPRLRPLNDTKSTLKKSELRQDDPGLSDPPRLRPLEDAVSGFAGFSRPLSFPPSPPPPVPTVPPHPWPPPPPSPPLHPSFSNLFLPIGHPRAKQNEYRPFDFMPISEGHLQTHELMHALYEKEDSERLPETEKKLLIIKLCTEMFIDILSHFVNLTNLNLENERQTFKLTSESDRKGDLNFFYDLLRKTCNMSPHKNGWGNSPNSKDNCVAACIDRIKSKSDEIWSHKGGLLRSNFQDILRNLRNDIVEVERQILGGQLYERRIDDLISTDTDVVTVMDSPIRNTFYMEPDNEMSLKSLELSKLFQEVCKKIAQQVPQPSFAADILDRKGISTVLNTIRMLHKEELLKHCREPYQWSKELRPGDVIGFEVRVTPENNKLEMPDFKRTVFKLKMDYNPCVLLVLSNCMSVIEAKLTVSKEYKGTKYPDTFYIHHDYDDNYYVSKLSAFCKASFICDMINSMTNNISKYLLFKIVNEEIRKLSDGRFGEIAVTQCDVNIEQRELEHYEIKTSHLVDETIKRTCKFLGMLIETRLASFSLRQLVISTMIPYEIYDKMLFEAMKVHVISEFEAKFGFLVYTRLERRIVEGNLLQLIKENTVAILRTFQNMYNNTLTDLKNVCLTLEKLKKRCRPRNMSELIKEWEKRKILTSSVDLTNLPSIVRCDVGKKDGHHCVKVFLKECNDDVQNLFKDQGKKMSFPDETTYEFINVHKDLDKKQEEARETKKKENNAPAIDRDLRLALGNFIASTAEKIYAKYSNVVGIDVSNFYSKHQEVTPCIVLYCLDKDFIPLGEETLPRSLYMSTNDPSKSTEIPCDFREEIIMFGSCNNCLGDTFNLGCNIGGPINGGSLGFFINSPFKGFLTAAHVAAEDAKGIYKGHETDFKRTQGNKENITHPFKSPIIIGTVERCMFGNFRESGLDVAIVRLITSGEISEDNNNGGRTLPIADPAEPSGLRVFKRGNATCLTEGVLCGLRESANCPNFLRGGNLCFFNKCFAVSDLENSSHFF